MCIAFLARSDDPRSVGKKSAFAVTGWEPNRIGGTLARQKLDFLGVRNAKGNTDAMTNNGVKVAAHFGGTQARGEVREWCNVAAGACRNSRRGGSGGGHWSPERGPWRPGRSRVWLGCRLARWKGGLLTSGRSMRGQTKKVGGSHPVPKTGTTAANPQLLLLKTRMFALSVGSEITTPSGLVAQMRRLAGGSPTRSSNGVKAMLGRISLARRVGSHGAQVPFFGGVSPDGSAGSEPREVVACIGFRLERARARMTL
jgi:hypothetical protein